MNRTKRHGRKGTGNSLQRNYNSILETTHIVPPSTSPHYSNSATPRPSRIWDIAEQFDIRQDTVSDHVSAIIAKLGAANRTEAVAIALRKHLLKV